MAYIPWRGRIIAALMLGRAGSGFSNQEMRRVESLLPSLGLARAAYGLPCTFEPLRAPTNPGLLRRLGFDRRFEILASTPTRDGTLVVRDLEGFREMVATAGGSELIWTRAALRDPSESGWPYVELLHLAAALAKQRRSALFVGCGGAVAMRQFARVYPGIGIDVVEREATVIELARAWYDLDAIPGVTVHVADGVDFIAHAAPSSWDVVVVDAYDAADIATAFARRPFFATLRRALHPGGAMAFNVIGTLDEPGPVRDIVRAARAELDSVRIVPVMGLDETYSPSTRRNVVVLATRAVQ
jgi:predicted O-methyltransferase YrrM